MNAKTDDANLKELAMQKLKFSKANAKLQRLERVEAIAKYLEGNRKVYSLDLLSGWSCPFAHECKSKVYETEEGRKVRDGKHTKYRCYSASQEAIYTGAYNLRKHNFDLLRKTKGVEAKAQLIQDSIPRNLGVCRIHSAGDFFSQEYFDAWVKVAEENPDKLFYSYTKSLTYWLQYKSPKNMLPNFVVTASRGGRNDKLIGRHKLREAVVLFDENQANVEIDHDDSHAANPDKRYESFGLLIHGIQPKGSKASQAVKKLAGKGSYSRK